MLPIVGFANVGGSGGFHSGVHNFDASMADSLLNVVSDTAQVADSMQNKQRKQTIDAPVYSTAKDSTIYALDNINVVYLYGDAQVKYQNLELKAAYIEFDALTKQAYAKGMPDSTGKIVGLPVFTEGGQTFEMDEIVYNFETKRARITGVITEQEGGFLHGETVKKMENDEFNLKGGRYTTCDHKHPHFSLHITKGKLIPNDKIVSGYAYLELLDVPLKFPGLPFGFFPITHKRAAGIILPEYRDEDRRGLGLSGGGFYFVWASISTKRLCSTSIRVAHGVCKALPHIDCAISLAEAWGCSIQSTLPAKRDHPITPKIRRSASIGCIRRMQKLTPHRRSRPA